MHNSTTVLNQLLSFLPEQQFQTFVGQHEADKYVKRFSCWNQLTTMLYAQATGKTCLREITSDLSVLDSTWSDLGLRSVAKSTIAYANANRPSAIFESLFYVLLKQCSGAVEEKSFSFKNDLHALDASTIDLCLSLFDWATFRKRKGAIKLHTDFNLRSQIPECITITTGKRHEVNEAHDLDFSSYTTGTIFVFDRGYTDYNLWWKIKKSKHHFVTRLKKNAQIVPLGEYRPATGKGILKDERIAFVLPKAGESYPQELRLVTFYNEEEERIYRFVTDEFRLSASNIAAIYKRRWDIEVFFRWIKQNLKIKTFLGTSENAVKTQIWIAMIYFLLVKWLSFCISFKGTLTELTRKLAVACLHRFHIIEVLSCSKKGLKYIKRAREGPQMSIF